MINRISFAALLLSLPYLALAQTDRGVNKVTFKVDKKASKSLGSFEHGLGCVLNEVPSSLDDVPHFVGGKLDLIDYIAANLNTNIGGSCKWEKGVLITFNIKKDGTITNVSSVSYQTEMEREAIRLVRKMPAWIPAKASYQNIEVEYLLPIRINLDETTALN